MQINQAFGLKRERGKTGEKACVGNHSDIFKVQRHGRTAGDMTLQCSTGTQWDTVT